MLQLPSAVLLAARPTVAAPSRSSRPPRGLSHDPFKSGVGARADRLERDGKPNSP